MSGRPVIPAALLEKMAEIGPIWATDTRGHIKLMADSFSAVLRDSPGSDADVRKDIEYGAHERQRFDLFVPRTKQEARAALIFVHGGAFTEGNRNRTPQFYSNVLHYFARFGVVGVNVGYRLAPDVRFPNATYDIASVVRWVREHADELSVDPQRIFLMGHSAGGAHTASYAYDRRMHPEGGPGLAGLIIVSGRVRADNRADNPNARRVEAYYGADASQYEAASPVTHVGPDSVDTFIAMAEFENPLIDVYCLELAHRLALAKGRAPPTMWLPKHNHTSIVAHLNTAEDLLGSAIRRFMKID